MDCFSINIGGRLMDLSRPKVMGILNVTPDSFYSESRCFDENKITGKVEKMLSEGMDILDLGACSTRPGTEVAGEEEEKRRLDFALKIIRKKWPEIVISVDTFRSGLAEFVVKEYGVNIINDISGGDFDRKMFPVVSKLNVPYILMHIKGDSTSTMQDNPEYDSLMAEITTYFSERVARLRDLGQNDIILDPGFGFGKTVENNYELLRCMDYFDIFKLPLLVGMSRKSMIFKLLGTTPQESLNGTTVLNTMALLKGANILRVHDIKEAVECVKIFDIYKNAGICRN